MQQKKIIFLASDCESSRWVYHALKKDFEFEAVIIEQPISKKKLVKGRLKRIGFIKVMGQVLFSALVVPMLKRKAKDRKAQLVEQYQLNSEPIDNPIKVYSVNDPGCLMMLRKANADIVIVNGTRIISKKTLQCSNAVFINMHVGITPEYRGSHGGYWAVANNDIANFGTTIHVIDAGVDTGPVLKQVFIQPSPKDNFTTYPVLQVALGIEVLKEVLTQALSGDLQNYPHVTGGNMYYQPTIWQYFMKPKQVE